MCRFNAYFSSCRISKFIAFTNNEIIKSIILIKPIITEKANNDSELNNRYTFQVEKNANKVQIKNEVESAYGVKVLKVRTINVRSDRRIRYTRAGMQFGKSNAIKKAIIQLADGESIDLYANV